MENHKFVNGAGDGTRTRDHLLGRQMLYQLSYSRIFIWWRRQDSNLRRLSPGDLQSPAIGQARRLLLILKSWRWDSNPRPGDYKSPALPTELRQLTYSHEAKYLSTKVIYCQQSLFEFYNFTNII